MNAVPHSLLIASTCLLAGCITVPVVQPAGNSHLSTRNLPPGTERVEVNTEDGTTLRGLFLPADDNAPVILHLLPAQTSITSGLQDSLSLTRFLMGLHAKGYASLVIDYRGIGASDGSRSPRYLGEDARAMWDEAVRRAGGQEDGVILRGASLGTLPLASLLESGAGPRAAVLSAPIRTETIAYHAPRQRRGAFLGTVISWFLRRPLDVDLLSVIRTTPVPLLVLLPERDDFLPEDEMTLVEEACVESGKVVQRMEGDHLQLVLRSYGWEVEGLSGKASGKLLDPEVVFLENVLSAASASSDSVSAVALFRGDIP